ncbi:MAG: flagellar basal body P-ring protein FlgI [Planctomycetota bacterium]
MKQATFAIACVILWSVQAAMCEAQDEPSNTKRPPDIEESDKPEPSESGPPEAAAGETPTAEPVAESKMELPDAVARASEAMLQRIARLQAEKTGPMIDDLCEVKHYGTGNLHGFGLVLDLEAIVASKTGEEEEEEEEDGQTSVDLEKLVETLNLLNQSGAKDDTLKSIVARLDGGDELTVVAVSAEAPPEGLRQGERIDCQVESIEGSSLENGHLLPTRLSTLGPGKEPDAAIAAGPLSDTGRTTGPKTVAGGCLVETDICDQFTKDNKITLVLDEEHSQFSIAQAVVDLINLEMQTGDPPVAKALNRHSIEVSVPAEYEEDPVAFVTRILKLPAPEAIAEDLGD